MTEQEVHLLLSDVKLDNDNLDYIKATGEICGKLRWDLVKIFAMPVVVKSVCDCGISHNGCICLNYNKCHNCNKPIK